LKLPGPVRTAPAAMPGIRGVGGALQKFAGPKGMAA